MKISLMILCLLIPAVLIAQDVPPVPPDGDITINKRWSVGPETFIAGVKFSKSKEKGVLSGELDAVPGGAIMLRFHWKGREVLGVGPALYLDADKDSDNVLNMYPALNVCFFKWAFFGFTVAKQGFVGYVLPLGKD